MRMFSTQGIGLDSVMFDQNHLGSAGILGLTHSVSSFCTVVYVSSISTHPQVHFLPISPLASLCVLLILLLPLSVDSPACPCGPTAANRRSTCPSVSVSSPSICHLPLWPRMPQESPAPELLGPSASSGLWDSSFWWSANWDCHLDLWLQPQF